MVNLWHDIEVGKDAPKVVNAVIEIPKDSKLKFELDKDTGLMKLDRFLYSAMHYPGDYGFIPQTYWEDGDPLDIVILTGQPVYPGMLAEARIIGVVHMNDSGESDDKIIAVYEKDPRFKNINSVKDVEEHILEEIRHFFERYKELEKKDVKVLQIKDRDAAEKVLEKGIELYKEKLGSR